MNFKKILIILPVIFMLVLGACGPDTQTDTAPETIPQLTLPPVIKEAVPTTGGEIVFPAPQQNPTALNPLKTKNVELYNMLSLIYEQPIRMGTDGKAQPELVETWEVDETGMTWTFHLRKGVQWQDGQGEMTSDDIQYTVEELIKLSNEESNYVYNKEAIASWNAPDEYTFQISQYSPGYDAVYFMTFPVLCKAYCESENIDTAKPVGTGPYQIAEFDMDEQVSFEVNPSWWKQAPYIQKLTAICIPNHDAEMYQFEQNLLDIVTTSSLTVDTYQKYQEIEYKDYLTQYYDCLVPNINGIFGDVNLRQAVAYGLDKREVVSKALLGHAVATDYPVSPDSYLSGGSSKIYEFNQQKAKELLELSGWKDLDSDGLAENVQGDNISEMTINLLIPANGEDTYRMDVAQNIDSQLLECGINVDIIEKEPAEYKTSLESGNYDLALCTFYMDINPDITNIVGTGGEHNYGNFSDPLLDGLLTNCVTAISEDTLKEAYSAMEDQFLAQMPHVGLYYRTNALLYNATLNIADNFRDRNLFLSIPQWYIYVEEPEA